MPILVEFSCNEEIWHTVVEQQTLSEKGTVYSENGKIFVMEYPSMTHFNIAVDRFLGLIDYQIITG